MGSATPFQRMELVETKLVPTTLSLNVPLPTVTDAGLSDVSVGTGLSTVKTSAFEAPPPGAGLPTVIAGVPPARISALGTVALILVEEAYVVASALPFQRTVEAGRKDPPATVRVKLALPAALLVGEMKTILGVGLSILKTAALEVPPAGAGFVRSLGGIVHDEGSVVGGDDEQPATGVQADGGAFGERRLRKRRGLG